MKRPDSTSGGENPRPFYFSSENTGFMCLALRPAFRLPLSLSLSLSLQRMCVCVWWEAESTWEVGRCSWNVAWSFSPEHRKRKREQSGLTQKGTVLSGSDGTHGISRELNRSCRICRWRSGDHFSQLNQLGGHLNPTGHVNRSVDMRRDRLLVAIALVTLLAADIHFILLPRLRSWYHLPRESCSCTNSSLEIVPWTTSQNITAVSTERGSKLERLFRHRLYNIRLPELGPEERLLEEDELVNYCKRKVSRWERYSTVLNNVTCLLGGMIVKSASV